MTRLLRRARTKILKQAGLALIGLSALMSAAAPAAAQGDLLVAPTRIILDNRRGAEVILSNIGAEEATYRIGLELRRMQPDGRLVPVSKDEANSFEQAALGMLRYAPRRITLPPGQPQSVRLAARPAADLPDGEYRVHMSFKAIPKPRSATAPAEASEGVSIQLIPIYGVTIPIIVRHGRLQSAVVINQPLIIETQDGPALAMTLDRSGAASTYGEIAITPKGASEPAIGTRGVAIYTDIDTRQLNILLTREQAAALRGDVRIEYRELSEAGGALIAALDARID